MRKICEMLRDRDVGAIGIGAMIVFISMVLVAGIAASVLIQTSTRLESQAMSTGQETIAEVATGLAVFDIIGYCSAVTANISRLAITVRPRAGSAEIDLATTFIELSDTSYKVVLKYRDTGNDWWDEPTGLDNLFGLSVFPPGADDFGILVLEDADSSCSQINPVINRGDKVILCIDTSVCFNIVGLSLGILERTDVWGSVVPEEGSAGVVAFRSPAAYNDIVMDLQ